ncbi:MAG: hypothetical protein HFJ38_01570 [Bacilli bacterium]|nr:hypothetical protein [Bacilli bacterium]
MKKQIQNNKNIDYSVMDNNFKGPIIIVVIVFLIIALFYLLTVFILNKKEFVVNENVSIQYSKIIAGESFDKKDKDYIVFYYPLSEHSDYTDIVSRYREKENHLPLYVVDLSEGINKSIVSDEENISVDRIQDLRIKDSAIIRFKDGKVSDYTTSSFEEFLDKHVE